MSKFQNILKLSNKIQQLLKIVKIVQTNQNCQSCQQIVKIVQKNKIVKNFQIVENCNNCKKIKRQPFEDRRYVESTEVASRHCGQTNQTDRSLRPLINTGGSE